MRPSIPLVWLGLAVLASAQAPLFSSLDNSLPQDVEASGDFDGDGDADLVVPGALLLNDGHGRFIRTPVTSLAFFRSQTKAADMNGDGLDDLVATSALLTLQVHLNGGGLGFTTTQTLVLGFPGFTIPQDFALGDVDGDGDVDMIVATLLGSGAAFVTWQPFLFLNNGAGTLTLAPSGHYPAVALPGNRVLLVDLDGDGDRDALFAGLGSGLVRLDNTGGWFFQSANQVWTGFFLTVDVGRFNADALPDLLLSTANSAVILFNSPGGFLQPVTSPLGPGNYATYAPIDLNGDGIDEVLQNRDRVLSVVPVSAGLLGPPIQSWTDLRLLSPQIFDGSVRDLDGDGDRDTIVVRAGEALALMSAGNGTLARVGGHFVDVTCGAWTNVGDVDADGDVDVFGQVDLGPGCATGLNDGAGYFSAGPYSTLSSSSGALYSVYSFDRDGDGDLDLYEALRPPGLPPTGPSFDYLWDNVGGSFTLAAILPSTADARGFLSADFDGDGDQDVLMGRWNTTPVPPGAMVLRMNLGAAGLAAPVSIGLPRANYDLDIGDFDGNGTIDVFQTNSVPYSLAGPADPSVVYLNNGSGAFTAIVRPAMSGTFTAAGHLNGDALTDLVIDNQVWFATGGGNFVSGPPLQSTLIGPPTLADVDLDGDLDLVETPATLMLNLGSGVFGLPQSFLSRIWSSVNDQQFMQTVVADVDRDGDPDLVAPGPLLLSNTTRQLAHGSIPRPGRPGSVDLYGSPNGAWFLFGSNGTASFLYPPWGTVMIDPASAQLGAMGLFAAAGTASFGVTLPNNPVLTGWTTHWQAIDASQMRFTNRLTVTVMGY